MSGRQGRDATREVRADQGLRDTWDLGIHSYLGFCATVSLSPVDPRTGPQGSFFVQIGDENVHIVRSVYWTSVEQIRSAPDCIRKELQVLAQTFIAGAVRLHCLVCTIAQRVKYTSYIHAKGRDEAPNNLARTGDGTNENEQCPSAMPASPIPVGALVTGDI